ncbi:MAG: SCP2 sterol-binding domain-containing protein [Candidatus Thorarchaeota archaeon]|jgi:putative sterol carrier protein|nr:SCP2 sterol-binding domain-containing protein [Candidatus Thorarchaeota archaeon]
MTDDLLELMRERIAIGLERKKTQEALDGWERKALLTLKDGRQYHFLVANNTIKVNEGPIDNPDMRVEASEETMRKLFLEEMGATTAILKRKLKVKGSTSDLMKLKHIF